MELKFLGQYCLNKKLFLSETIQEVGKVQEVGTIQKIGAFLGWCLGYWLLDFRFLYILRCQFWILSLEIPKQVIN